MANFIARVRTSYKDIGGLVLDVDGSGVVEATDNLGFVQRWTNPARGVPGGKFGNPFQDVAANQPILNTTGASRVEFNRASSHYLKIPVQGDPVPADSERFALAFKFTQGADVSNNQVIFGDDGATRQLRLRRREGAGDSEIVHGPGGGVTVAGDLPNGTYLYNANAMSTVWQQDGGAYGVGVADVTLIDPLVQYFLGRGTAGNYLDGILDSFQVWAKDLSPLERDLAWQTVDPATDHATETRAPMIKPVWTDATGNLAAGQVDRLNPQVSAPHRYIRGTLVGGTPHRVQIGAEIGELTLPDSLLGGDLFTLSWLEIPGSPVVTPVVFQDAGWSSVFDVVVTTTGHYCARIDRPNGGSFLVHFDIEATP